MFHGHLVVEIRMVVMYDINFERNVTVMPLKCHAKMLIVLKMTNGAQVCSLVTEIYSGEIVKRSGGTLSFQSLFLFPFPPLRFLLFAASSVPAQFDHWKYFLQCSYNVQ